MYGGVNLGGSISGSVKVLCTNGSITLSGKTCTYTGAPKAFNTQSNGTTSPKTTYITSGVQASYCNSLLGSGATVTATTLTLCSAGASAYSTPWFNWSGRVVGMMYETVVSGNGYTSDGGTCFAWNRDNPMNKVKVVTSLTCTTTQ